MSGGSSDIRATVDAIVRLQNALRHRYPSDPQNVQKALENLRLRANALLGGADTDVHEAIEHEFYSFVESSPEIRQLFQSLCNAEIADVLRRGIEELQGIRQKRPLTQRELETLREAQSFYEDVTRGEPDEAKKGDSRI